jgi:hypothetical protein
VVLLQKRIEMLEQEFTANCLVFICLLYNTRFGGEIEAMSSALIQLLGRTGSFEKAVIFSDTINSKI